DASCRRLIVLTTKITKLTKIFLKYFFVIFVFFVVKISDLLRGFFMLAKRILPCFDIDRGRVVKGINFLSLTDAGDPVEQARRYDSEGADELVFLDITASSDSRNIVLQMVRAVADAVFIPFTVGGGIRTVDDIRQILLAGADKISLNTASVLNPELIAEGALRFGSQCIVVAIDA